ncbi:MAG: hypothetical protein JWO60_1603 [Frankiales bacterium]|nr:hypothetical protein [Frankiales bacterium]
MERGSDKHSARMDDALEHEVRGMMTAGRDTHAEEWKSAEPSGEDQPSVDLSADGSLHGGVPDGMTEADVEARSTLAQYLGKEVWPATGAQLLAVAQGRNAPDAVLAQLRKAHADVSYLNLQEVWAAISGGHVEQHRF